MEEKMKAATVAIAAMLTGCFGRVSLDTEETGERSQDTTEGLVVEETWQLPAIESYMTMCDPAQSTGCRWDLSCQHALLKWLRARCESSEQGQPST